MKYNNNVVKGTSNYIGLEKFNKLANFVWDKKEQKLLKIISINHNNAGKDKVEIITKNKTFKFSVIYHILTICDCFKNLPIYNSETHFKRDLKTQLEKEEQLAQQYFKNYENKIKDIEAIKTILGDINE